MRMCQNFMQKLKKISVPLLICLTFLLPLNRLAATSGENPETIINETINIIDDSRLVEAVEAGSYPIIISYQNQSGETLIATVYITVYHQRTIENPIAKEAIDARDVAINPGFFTQLTDPDLVKLSNVRAWNVNDGTPIPITKIMRQTIDAKSGHYTITFETAKGTKTTINVLERQNLIVYENKEDYYFFTRNEEYVILEAVLFFLLLLTLISVLYFVLQIEIKMTGVYHILYKRRLEKERKLK